MNPDQILKHPAKVLSEAQRRAYFEDGFILVERAIPPELLKRLVAASDELVERSRKVTKSDTVFDIEPDHRPDAPRLRRVSSPQDQHPVFWELASESVLPDIMADLLGPNVKFHHSKLNYKWKKGGQEVKWHYDICSWPHTDYSPLTVGIYLHDCDMEQGPLGVIPGSHEMELFNQWGKNGEWLGYIPDEDMGGLDLSKARYLTGPAGSITIHNCRAVHGSPANNSDVGRPLLLYTFSSADSFPYTVNPIPSPRSGAIVRGEKAKYSNHDPRGCLMPPDWSGGYGSIFSGAVRSEDVMAEARGAMNPARDYPGQVLLHIAGRWCDGDAGRTLPVIDPATGEEIAKLARAEAADMDRAAQAAADAFRQWRAVSAHERAAVLRRASALLRERAETIAQLLTREQGKPLAEARIELAVSADIVDWFAEEARRTYGRIIPSRNEAVTQQVLREPVGVVLALSPWNFPVIQSVRKVSAALAAGCTVLLKAPEETPASPAEMVRCFIDAGLPPGALNLLYGVPAEISGTLIAHPVVRKVSFTGSTVVGKQLAALAGMHMKRTTMELGGHAPVIVCEDADLERAAQILAANKFRNCGQVCIAPTRFMVQNSVRERFVSLFAEQVAKLRVGRGDAEGTTMGPLANVRRVDAMQDFVADALAQGARVAFGGQRLSSQPGFFHQPTVLADVPASARCMNEEPFGPLAIVNGFDRVEDAIAEANRLPYGLAAYAYTASLKNRHLLARGIESGMVSINHHGVGLPETPFGGVKDSGYGSEGGLEAMEAYLNTKFVTESAQ